MKLNDPDFFRTDAVRAAIGSLGDNTLYRCPGTFHRIALVGFGDQSGGAEDTIVYIDSATIEPKLDAFPEWLETREKINNDVPTVNESLGATDFLSAFHTAQSILTNWQTQNDNSSGRLRGVVLIADGGPCVYDLGCLVGNNTMNVNAYLNDMEAYLDPNGVNYPWRGVGNVESVHIWFVGFNDTTVSGGYNYLNPEIESGRRLRDFWTRITEGHGGSFIVLDSSSDQIENYIGGAILSIVDTITDSIVIDTICEEPFFIPPYYDQAVMRILKIGSNPSVPLSEVEIDLIYDGPLPAARFEKGNRTDGEGGGTIADYRSDGPNEVYVIQSPSPGQWQIEVQGADECRDLQVSYLPFPIKGQALTPQESSIIPQYDEESYYDPDEPAYLRYQLFGRTEDNPISPLPEYPIYAEATVMHDGKIVQQFELKQDNDKIWQGTEPFQVRASGRYDWTVEFTAPILPDGEEIKKLLDDKGTFTVSKVQRFQIALQDPNTGGEYPLNTITNAAMEAIPLTIVARIVDQNGTPLSPVRLLTGEGDGALYAVVSSGTETSKRLPMQYDSVNNQWQVKTIAGQNGVPVRAGVHQIEVSLNEATYNREEFRPASNGGKVAVAEVTRPLVLGGSVAMPDSSTAIPQYEEGSLYDPQAPVYFEYEFFQGLTDSNSDDLLSTYPMTVTVDLLYDDAIHQKLTLSSQGDGRWRSTEPIKVPYAGAYEWLLKATVDTSGKSEPAQQYEDAGTFDVSKVGRFYVELMEPQADQSYALNEIVGGRQSMAALPILVRILDEETDQALSADEVTDDETNNALLTAQISSAGANSAPIALTYDVNRQAWLAEAVAGTFEVPDTPGLQTIDITLDESVIDTTQYRPSFRKPGITSAKFERFIVTPLEIQVEPVEYKGPTFTGTLGCINAEPVPINVKLTLINGTSGIPVDPSRVADGEDAVASLASVSLVDRNGAVVETGTWERADSASGGYLKATLGISHTVPGQYSILVEPIAKNLAVGYQYLAPDKITEVAVTRTSSLLYNPGTCTTARNIGLGLLLLLLIWMGISWFRRPLGEIELVNPDDQYDVHTTERLGKSLGLLFRPKQTITVESDPDISKIEVTRASADDATYGTTDDIFHDMDGEEFGAKAMKDTQARKNKRAIRVRVFDMEGGVMNDTTMTADEPTIPLTSYSELRYQG
ncbi:hypothetical protein KC887_01680 [Candidatus Kaiserbacteria bacterium]|nr:hypothetical protein [Candidatus Kaiserbacteria bacterium]